MLNIEGFLGKFAYRTRDGDRFRLYMLWEGRNGPEHILPHRTTRKEWGKGSIWSSNSRVFGIEKRNVDGRKKRKVKGKKTDKFAFLSTEAEKFLHCKPGFR